MNSPDWDALDRLRSIFIEGAPVRGAYWGSHADLASYDATLGERIGWKWDAVLAELRRRGWRPPSGRLVDFGCGSGVAGRRVLAAFGAGTFSDLVLHDKSPLAETYAASRAREEFPGLTVKTVPAGELSTVVEGATLVISHVLGELPPAARERLQALASRAAAVLWVEPGRHEDSRALIECRERLRDTFSVVAPCTHGGACGLTAPGNERHWCHFFGRPPWEIFADPFWSGFSRRLGVDLRSLPYSYLVLQRASGPPVDSGAADHVRLIGLPRFYKGYARLFVCGRDGVSELTWAKRSGGELFKQMKDGETGSLFRIQREASDLRAIEEVGGAGGTNPD
jgi:hypothetical protein